MKALNKIVSSKTGLILLTIFLTIFSSIKIYPDSLILSNIFSTLLALLFFLFVPVLIIKKVLKKDLLSFGFNFPKKTKKAIFLILIFFLIFIPILFYLSNQLNFQSYYLNQRGLSADNFLILGVILSAIYFFSEEFLFRGFLFFFLYKKIGPHTFWVLSLLFAFLHITKPIPEIIVSFFISITLCYLSYKTKSFLPAFILHFLMAVFTNFLILF